MLLNTCRSALLGHQSSELRVLSRLNHHLLNRSLSTSSVKCQASNDAGESSDKMGSDFMRNEKCEDYDIIINGGGIVGLSFLLSLQRSPFLRNLRVLMLENNSEPSTSRLQELINHDRKLSNRVSSLTLASKRFLDKLEVWNSIQTFAKPISSMHVWSTSYSKGVTFTPQRTSFVDNFIRNDDCTVDNQHHSSDSVCFVLENDILLSALMNNIDNSSIKFNTRLESISSDDSHIYLKTNDGHEVSTCLLIGSDGFDSFVRKVSNFNYQSIDLGQNGIVGTIQVSKQSDADLNDVAYQRFIPHMKSVLAILPLTDYHASIVLSVPRARTTAFMEMTDEAFVDTLNEALFYEKTSQQGSPFSFVVETIDNIIDRIVPQDKLQSSLPRVNPPQVLSVEEGSRATYPLHFGTTLPKLVSTIKGGGSKKIVLIGDAAHRIHPLAGQGLNLGLGDAEVLSRRLERSLSNGEDIFADHHSAQEQLNQALFDMERQRLVKLIPMMAAIQTMQPLFSYLPGNTFRVFNQLSLIKNEVVRFANSV